MGPSLMTARRQQDLELGRGKKNPDPKEGILFISTLIWIAGILLCFKRRVSRLCLSVSSRWPKPAGFLHTIRCLFPLC